MADFMSGIKPISPGYPVRPVQPAEKDRKPGDEHRKTPPSDDDGAGSGGREPGGHQTDDRPDEKIDDKPTIDEHV